MRFLAVLLIALVALVPSHITHAVPVADYHPACPVHPKPGTVTCFAQVVDGSVHPLAGGQPPYSPDGLRTAYSLPSTIQGNTPQTVAIVDVGGDSHLLSDLATFDTQFGLPACTTENGCISIVNHAGQPSPLEPSWGWEIEISLDVSVVHGLCPQCHIILVESSSTTSASLSYAENTAASLGATEISNSWGGPESGGATQFDSAFNHPGIAITVSTGDSGWMPSFPADEPSVIAVGGTSLYTNPDGSYSTELAWSKAGSGCSGLEPAQPWQLALPNWADTKCGRYRASGDVSAVADPNTGVAIYNEPDGWIEVGGTSLSSPIVASVIALAGGVAGEDQPSRLPYIHPNGFRDVVSGSNGGCVGSMCNAEVGYDGPTGVGAVVGVSGFAVGSVPTPAPTQTPTLLPSATPILPTATPPATSAPPTTPPPPATTPTSLPSPVPTASPSPTRPSPPAATSTAVVPPTLEITPTAPVPSPSPTAHPRPSPTPLHRHHRGHCLLWLDGPHSICLWWHRGN